VDKINTKVVKIDPNNIDYEILSEAALIIQNGGTVIFPTETVYGLGADALNEDACDKIFKAKGRPSDNPLIVHITTMEELNELVDEIPQNAKILAKHFWPGPLTMILNKKDIVSYKVTAGLETVAVRMPKSKIATELIKLSKRPIAAPSANTSGKPSPTNASHVIDDMFGKVDMIIDGGSCEIGLESSVIDITSETPTILRPGGVTKEDVEKLFGKCDYDPAIIKSDDKIIPKSPGQKYRHYSPKAEVILYKGNLYKIVNAIKNDCKRFINAGKKVGIMATTQTKDFFSDGIVRIVGDRTNPITIASDLFNELRNFDALGVDIILAEAFDDRGIGKAIMNRLEKASSKKNELGKIKILLVCTGNTCRSTMTEGIMKSTINDKNLDIDVSSAGISAIIGDKASNNAVIVLNELGIDLSYHRAKQVTDNMLRESDLVLTMTKQHKDILLRSFKDLEDKIYTLKEFTKEGLSNEKSNDLSMNKSFDIQDPYGGNYDVYKSCSMELEIEVKRVLDILSISNTTKPCK